MSTFDKYMLLKEAEKSSLYGAGNEYTARVVHKNGEHTVKFFLKGKYLEDADYTTTDADDAHKFAYDEMKHRKMSTKKSIDERINMPQGHLESADRISDDSKKNGVSPKKMMGNRTPLEIIAKILAGK